MCGREELEQPGERVDPGKWVLRGEEEDAQRVRVGRGGPRIWFYSAHVSMHNAIWVQWLRGVGREEKMHRYGRTCREESCLPGPRPRPVPPPTTRPVSCCWRWRCSPKRGPGRRGALRGVGSRGRTHYPGNCSIRCRNSAGGTSARGSGRCTLLCASCGNVSCWGIVCVK